MSKNKKASLTASKIDINENLEPVIVNLNEKQYKEELKKQNKKENANAFNEAEAKKAVINKVFGIPNDQNITTRQNRLKKLISIIFIIFVIGCLAIIFYNDFFGEKNELASFNEAKDILFSNWYYFLIALFTTFLVLLFKGTKLSVLCHVTTKKFHFKTCFETGIIGTYYNNVTPLAVGGQPFEIYHLTKHGVNGGAASSLPIVAFFLNQVAFVVLSIISLALLKKNTFNEFTSTLPVIIKSMSIIGLVLCMIVPSLVFIFSLTPRICGFLVKFVISLGGKLRIIKNPKTTTFNVLKTVMLNSRCIKKIATSPIRFIISVLLSFGEQLANASIAYFTLRFFGFDMLEVGGFVEWLMVVQLCFILYSAISFIPTPGNSGAADISFNTLFAAGMTVGTKPISGLAFPALIVWRILSFYSFIIIGFIFIRRKNRKEKRKNTPPKQPTLLDFD